MSCTICRGFVRQLLRNRCVHSQQIGPARSPPRRRRGRRTQAEMAAPVMAMAAATSTASSSCGLRCAAGAALRAAALLRRRPGARLPGVQRTGVLESVGHPLGHAQRRATGPHPHKTLPSDGFARRHVRLVIPAEHCASQGGECNHGHTFRPWSLDRSGSSWSGGLVEFAASMRSLGFSRNRQDNVGAHAWRNDGRTVACFGVATASRQWAVPRDSPSWRREWRDRRLQVRDPTRSATCLCNRWVMTHSPLTGSARPPKTVCGLPIPRLSHTRAGSACGEASDEPYAFAEAYVRERV